MSELSRLEAGSVAWVIPPTGTPPSSSSRSIEGGRVLEPLRTGDRAKSGEGGCSLCGTRLYAMLQLGRASSGVDGRQCQ